jgi:hypothetical protein
VNPLIWPSKEEIGRDIGTLCQSVIKACWQEARVILDCKHWAKHRGMCDDIDDKLRFIVEWHPMTNAMGDDISERDPVAWGGSGARAACLSG